MPDSSYGGVRAQSVRELLDAVLDASVDALLITNARDLVLRASPAAARLFGRRADDLEGAPLTRVIVRADNADAGPSLHELATRAGGRGSSEEVRGRLPDGRLIPLELSRAWYPVDGELRAVVVLRDLSEQKRARAALRRSEARLRRVVETSGGGIIVVGPRGHLREVNDGYAHMLGYARADLVRAKLADLAHPDDRAAVGGMLRALASRVSEHEVSRLRYRRRDGSIIWCHARLVGEYNDEGELQFAIGLMQDFTEQAEAEAELRAREAYLGALFNSARDGMMSVGADDRVVVVNRAALEMFDQTEETLVDLPVSALLRGLDSDRSEERLRAEGVRSDGTTFPVEVSISAAGDLNVSLYVVHDLSARLKLEAELTHAQKMEAIGTLASGVAHDFNNLLMGISGCTEIAFDALPSDRAVRPYLAEIKKAADSGISITRRLLNFGRPRSEDAVEFELNVIVSEMEKMLGRLLGAQVELEVLLLARDSRVRADPGQIDQVLMNLTLNARDAMPRGGRVVVQTRELPARELARRELARPHLALTVRDTGIGMAPAGLEQIFEPFFTTKPAGAGTGLGMATVYSVVKAASGHIDVKSAPGAGTTVEILLPLAGARAPSSRRTSRGMDERRRAPPVRATVLLVEDEPLVRMAIRYYLEDAGYRVLVASDGRESLSCSRAFQGPIDLLLTDTVLPNQSGPEVAALISRERPEVRALFMSAHSPEQLAEQGFLPAGTSTLQKPFGRDALLDRLRHELDARSRGVPPTPVDREVLSADREN